MVDETEGGEVVWENHSRRSRRNRNTRDRTMLANTRPPGDVVDAAINAAQSGGEPIDMAAAFPNGVFSDTFLAPQGGLPSVDGPTPDGLQRVARIAPNYLTEYRLRLLHRLILRGVTQDQQAALLGVSIRYVRELRARLNSRLREEAAGTDGYLVFGQSKAFYDEIRAMAMRIATDEEIEPCEQFPEGRKGASRNQRLDAMRVALHAEGDRHRFMQLVGFYDYFQFKPQGELDERQQSGVRVTEMLRIQMDGQATPEDVEAMYTEVEDTPDADGEDDEFTRVLD
jgi:hypothetical protein